MMVRYLILLILCCPILAGIAAEKDSLELFLSRKDLPQQAKVDFLNMVARDLSYVNPAKGAEFSFRALDLSQQINYTKGEAQALRGIATSLLSNDQFYLALNNLQKAIHLFESIDDSIGIANCHISLGHTYRRLLDRKKELYHHQLAYDYFSRKGSEERKAVTTHNLGETFLNIGELNKATRLTERAITLTDSLNNLTVLSSCYKAMGKIWIKKNDLAQASIYFEKVLQLADRLGEGSQKVATVDALLNLAMIADLKNKRVLAIEYLKEAESLAKKYTLHDFITPIYEGLMALYVKQGNLNKIDETLNAYNKTLNQLNQAKFEVISRFSDLIIHTDSLESSNLALKEKSALQEKLITEKNVRNTITIILLLALVALTLTLIGGIIKLRHSNNYLTAQRTIIRTQNRELEELNAVKDKFLSILSHDIKAPLLGLKSYADMLTSEKIPIDTKQLASFGEELKKQLESTSTMADNLIMWVKLQMKSFTTQPVLIDLAAALVENYKLFGPVIEQKGLKLDHQEVSPCYVWADRNQLDFILRNLINNAIKYSFRHGTITVDLIKQKTEAVLRFTDQGVGMSAQTMESVSEYSHFRSESGTEGERGTGMGLRICREFAALNNGKIEIISNEGTGSIFTLTLPIKQA